MKKNLLVIVGLVLLSSVVAIIAYSLGFKQGVYLSNQYYDITDNYINRTEYLIDYVWEEYNDEWLEIMETPIYHDYLDAIDAVHNMRKP